MRDDYIMVKPPGAMQCHATPIGNYSRYLVHVLQSERLAAGTPTTWDAWLQTCHTRTQVHSASAAYAAVAKGELAAWHCWLLPSSGCGARLLIR